MKKKRRTTTKSSPDARARLEGLCRVAGLDDGAAAAPARGGGTTTTLSQASILTPHHGISEDDLLMGCFEEMERQQLRPEAPAAENGAEETSEGALPSSTRAPDRATTDSGGGGTRVPPPPPPGLDRVPNPRVELARHLRASRLSSLLLVPMTSGGETKGLLRMPAFERWLIDARHEERERRRERERKNGVGWPSKKNGKTRRKRQDDPHLEREERRIEREAALPELDPIFPSFPMETDASSLRLADEIAAACGSAKAGERAKVTCRELCLACTDSAEEVRRLEAGVSRYFKLEAGGSNGRKIKKKKGESADRVVVEWSEDNDVVSLVFIRKKIRGRGGESVRPDDEDGDGGDEKASAAAPDSNRTGGGGGKPKPFVVKINAAHYRKLRKMFDAAYGIRSGEWGAGRSAHYDATTVTHAFHVSAFCLTLRYSSLSGGQQLSGDLRGGGMQGAVHAEVFDALSHFFGGVDVAAGGEGGSAIAAGTGTECFASPFNSCLPRYCSAFPTPDVDGHFGSHGDFFDLPDEFFLSSGTGVGNGGGRGREKQSAAWCEVNPPFSPGLVDDTVRKMRRLCDLARSADADLNFVVVVPTCRDGGGGGESGGGAAVHRASLAPFRRMVDGPYRLTHVVLPSGGHGYLEGAQHLRPTSFKESRYDTSVVVLGSGSVCSDDASVLPSEWSEGRRSDFESKVREAFASRHAEEIKDRRRRQGQTSTEGEESDDGGECVNDEQHAEIEAKARGPSHGRRSDDGSDGDKGSKPSPPTKGRRSGESGKKRRTTSGHEDGAKKKKKRRKKA